MSQLSLVSLSKISTVTGLSETAVGGRTQNSFEEPYVHL